MKIPYLVGLVLVCLWPDHSLGDEIAGWRGDGTATFKQCQPPHQWGPDSDNILWRYEVTKGYSSPVLYGDRIWVTASPSQLICLDARSGKLDWKFSANYALVLGEQKAQEIEAKYQALDDERRQAGRAFDQLRKADPDSPRLEQMKEKRKQIDQRRKELEKEFPRENRGGAGNTAATVLCDGKNVYAVFGTGIVVSLTVDGKKRWAKHLEVPQQGFGHSSSPVMANGKLIVHIQNLIALDPATGNTVWTANVPAKFGTPAVAEVGGQPLVITPAGYIVETKAGKVLAEKAFRLSHNSPIVHDKVIYAHESGRIKALQLPASLDPPFELKELWKSSATSDQRMATAVFHDGLLYSVGRKGVMEVTDASTGQLVYRQRSKIGEVFSSPVVAGDKVFLSGKDGKTMVFKPGRQFEQIALNQLERISSLPVFHGSRMYVRTDKSLYCIGKPSADE